MNDLAESKEGLLEQLGSDQKEILVKGLIGGLETFRLPEGMKLIGERATLVFSPWSDGVQLSSENEIRDVTLVTSPEQRAIYNDYEERDLGTLSIHNVRTQGMVQLLAKGKVRKGNILTNGLRILGADTRYRKDVPLPHAYGVDVLQGAFTLFNLQDEGVKIKGDLRGLFAGLEGSPAKGCGVFISGAGFSGGSLQISRLETGPIFSDGGIPLQSPDLITAGVFTLYGVEVEEVHNVGPVTTYGVNDMVLDNWGKVHRWIAEDNLTSYGPSGVGFVNFGSLNYLKVNAPIETFGLGARGFNVYDGKVGTAEFERIVTHGDAAVGVQIGRSLEKLVVHHDILTYGSVGDSLVKGKIIKLAAHSFSVLEDGEVGEVEIKGGVSSEGDEVATFQVQGKIEKLTISGEIRAEGEDADAVAVKGGELPLQNLRVVSSNGVAVRLENAKLTALRGLVATGAKGDLLLDSESRLLEGGRSIQKIGHLHNNSFDAKMVERKN